MDMAGERDEQILGLSAIWISFFETRLTGPNQAFPNSFTSLEGLFDERHVCCIDDSFLY